MVPTLEMRVNHLFENFVISYKYLISSYQVLEIGKSDLNAVENYIGSKKYLFGDKPCLEDAVIFSIMTQVYYNDNDPFNGYLKGKNNIKI